jgi:hypothetical protein
VADLFTAREAARNVLKALRVTRADQIVIEDLAMARGVFVREGPLEGAEARLLRKGGRGVIRVREDLPEAGRKRFAIAHDLGHWELHPAVSQWALCTAQEIETYQASAPELEANAFAGELLMPTVLMRPRCEDAKPDLDVVRALADEFHTTLTATALRFVEECRETCVAVFSENRKVLWWKAREGSRVWIAAGQDVDRRSAAWGPSTSKMMQPVPVEAWFPEWSGQGKREVYEQTMPLGRYEKVLTLLWIVDSEDEEEDDEDDSQWSRSLGSSIPSWKRR